MKRLFSFLIILLTLTLVGCGEEEVYVGEVKYINIRIDDEVWYKVAYPADDYITSTDGYGQWVFNSGGTIMVYTGDMTRTIRNTKEYAVYLKSYDVTLAVQNNASWAKYLEENEPVLCSGLAELKKDSKLSNPHPKDGLEYKVTSSGVYMPPEYAMNTYLMPAYKYGTSYFTSGVRYKNEREMEQLALSYLQMYEDGEVEWLQIGDDFVARNNSVGVGYKKLTVNKYVFFLSSEDMFDYVLLNTQRMVNQ